jgi:hypothetical protein
VVFHRVSLGRTVPTALVTGLILFLINQLEPALRDPGSVSTWVRSGLCFVVPFCVSNVGLLMASRAEDTVIETRHETGTLEAEPGVKETIG